MNPPQFFEVAVHYSDLSTANYMVKARDAWEALATLASRRKPSRSDKQVTHVNARPSIYGDIVE